jgi:Cdc6-like AAA superfamily ATPase
MTSYDNIVRQVDQVIFNLGESTHKRRRVTTGTAEETAPIGLERQYHELLQVLQRGLLGKRVADSDCNAVSHNASALLMGPRGNGKTWVLEQCLHKLELDVKNYSAQGFRVVRLNGLLLRGEDVGIAVREITRQIGQVALEESFRRLHRRENQSDSNEPCEPYHMLKDFLQRESLTLRTRKTSFNSMLSFLDEVLRLARVDSIPLLIVLDELDAFLTSSHSSSTSSVGASYQSHLAMPLHPRAHNNRNISSISTSSPSNRQLLLYHLLDRVADHGSLISFVGITTRLSTVGMFEKRVKSRAEGTSKVIYFGHLSSYELLIDSLLSKVQETLDNTSTPLLETLKTQLKMMLSIRKNSVPENTSKDNTQRDLVSHLFHRSYQLGKDFRWFSRVLSVALSLAVGDFISKQSVISTKDHDVNASNFILSPYHLLQGLSVISGGDVLGRDLHDDVKSTSVTPLSYDTPRLQALKDVSGAQLAVLFAAKRIISRDSQAMTPITYDCLYREYYTSFVRSGRTSGPDQYDEPIFFKAFVQLSQMGMIDAAANHTGGGPLQYTHDVTRYMDRMDPLAVKKLPLHINVDVTLELGAALKQDSLVGCTTALKEWGNKSN